MKYTVWVLIALLTVLQQDYFNWDDARLVFGFLPSALFYHGCISLASVVLWIMATRFCWPEGVGEVEPVAAGGRGDA